MSEETEGHDGREWDEGAEQEATRRREQGNMAAPTPEQRNKADELREWWARQAMKEIDEVALKAAIYGSNSLSEVGLLHLRAAGARTISQEQALETGCLVYLHGKVQRWIDASLRGERPADDTIHDIKVYAGMVERIRETGTWP